MLASLTEVGADGGSALPPTTFAYHAGTLPGSSPAESYKAQLKEVANGYGGRLFLQYGGHTPDGWYRLQRRYRVTQETTETGVGAAGTGRASVC